MQGKQRLEWLDAMRGFTMILVVAYHVGQMCFGMNLKTSTSMPFIVLFRMPLFFFVSGFLAWKADMIWTRNRLGTMIWKKFKIQVIPTIVFLTVCLVVRAKEFWPAMERAMASPTKSGYWFTWALLIMFVIYYVFAYFEQKIQGPLQLPRGREVKSEKCHPDGNAPHSTLHASHSTLHASRSNSCGGWVILVLWLVSIIIYETAFMPKYFKYPGSAFMRYSSLIEVVYYFQFFLFGNVVHRYWDKVERLFDSRWFFPVVTVIAFVCAADVLKWHTLRLMWVNLPRTVAMYALMLMVVMFFRYYKDSVSKETVMGRGLQYIGVRTLDIYLLHFILMPRLKMVGPWLDSMHPNFILEVVMTVSVALVVIVFCCLASNILRVSPFFKKYLFGRK
ncbi:MAG: acyltransferase family protein [Bacteroidaceae bacterium]|nr:acyltransferase family protein [Bacteroidaceae bacterium]